MDHYELSQALAEKERCPLSILWKAALWLEKQYRKGGSLTIPPLIAQHYEILGAHPDVREDPYLVALLRAHADYWANLEKERESEAPDTIFENA